MRRLFGSKKKNQAPPPPSLDETSESMEKRIKFLRDKISECDKDLAELRQSIKGSRGSSSVMNKQRAVQVLKRRKMYASQLDSLQGQQFNVEQLNFNQQSIQDTINAAGAMKAAHQVQKQQLKEINLDQIEDMMEDIADLAMDTEEVNEIMSRNYSVDVDEAELEAELDELDEELLAEDLNSGNLSVPSYLPSKTEQEEEKTMTS